MGVKFFTYIFTENNKNKKFKLKSKVLMYTSKQCFHITHYDSKPYVDLSVGSFTRITNYPSKSRNEGKDIKGENWVNMFGLLEIFLSRRSNKKIKYRVKYPNTYSQLRNFKVYSKPRIYEMISRRYF